jgi:hypothetical protein
VNSGVECESGVELCLLVLLLLLLLLWLVWLRVVDQVEVVLALELELAEGKERWVHFSAVSIFWLVGTRQMAEARCELEESTRALRDMGCEVGPVELELVSEV